MPKVISQAELSKIVNALLTNPDSVNQDITSEQQSELMRAIAHVVCDYCGGVVSNEPSPAVGEMNAIFVEISGNDSLPSDGGVWADCDEEGVLFEKA